MREELIATKADQGNTASGGLPAGPGQMGFGSYYAGLAGSDAAGIDAAFTLASARLAACR